MASTAAEKGKNRSSKGLYCWNIADAAEHRRCPGESLRGGERLSIWRRYEEVLVGREEEVFIPGDRASGASGASDGYFASLSKWLELGLS